MIDKIDQLKKRLSADVDAVLITSWVNRRYFTGLKTSDGILIITKEISYLLVDFRYIEVAEKLVKNCNVILIDRLSTQLRNIAVKHNIKSIGIETAHLTVQDFIRFKAIFSNSEIIFDNKINLIIEDMRRYKSLDEIEYIKKAQFFAERAFYDILGYIKPKRTEREIAARLEFVMKSSGSQNTSFSTIVSSGKNTSKPHAVPTNKPIENGDFVMMDFGATYGEYCSDMTRTVAVGDVSDYMQQIYEIVLKAQIAALSSIKIGTKCCDVDKVARDIIANAGYGDCFNHTLGHSLGIEIHELPVFSSTAVKSICKSGYVMTVEPGIYIQEKFGVRIEDMVFIGDNTIINFTKADKSLIML